MDGFYNPAIQDAMRQNYYGNYMQQFAGNPQQASGYDWWNDLNNQYAAIGDMGALQNAMGAGIDWSNIPATAGQLGRDIALAPYGALGNVAQYLTQRMQPGLPPTMSQMQNMQQMIGSSPQQQVLEGFNNPNWSYNYSLNQWRPADVEKF